VYDISNTETSQITEEKAGNVTLHVYMHTLYVNWSELPSIQGKNMLIYRNVYEVKICISLLISEVYLI